MGTNLSPGSACRSSALGTRLAIRPRMLHLRHNLTQLALLALLATSPGCGRSEWSSARDGGAQQAELEGRTFLLQSAQGFSQVAGTTVRVSFTEGELQFHAGCNSHFASYTLRDDTLRITQGFGSTLIGCGNELQAQDDFLARFLAAEPKLSLTGDQLTLTGTSATLVLLDREVADPDRPLAGQTWEVDSYLSDQGATAYALPAPPTVRFEADGNVHVQSTCNAGEGTYTVAGDRITLSSIGYTERGCPDGNQRRAEQALQEVLQQGTITFTIEAARLTLMRGQSGLTASAR